MILQINNIADNVSRIKKSLKALILMLMSHHLQNRR